MDRDFDLYIDVSGEQPPNPMIKVNIICQILDKNQVLKVVTNNEFSYRNIRNLIKNKSKLSLIQELKIKKDFSIYIKRTS